jgi:3-isopropylmalate/(R)-2-methylmalate dehydratase small subunit
MEALQRVSGVAAPFMRINIDTDQIIPALFLGGTDAKGYGAHLFHGWRFLADGTPNPEFILNQAPFDQSEVLLADRNFGCGSSRERAPKALREFGGIFFNNCYRNGIVPVELPIEQIKELVSEVEASSGQAKITVDLEALCVSTGSGKRFSFTAPPALREMLLKGLDEISLTLSKSESIEQFRTSDRAKRPWAYAV